METNEVIEGGQEVGIPGNNGDGSKKKVRKGLSERTRFQLFDPTVRSDLFKLCEGGVAHLKLENDKEEKDEVSLEFEGDSEDEVENLPHDNGRTGKIDEINGKSGVSTGLFCSSCNVAFSDLPEQRLHYTLDWHRYNVKIKLQNQGAVTEAKFYEMMDDLSSIDGSDEEEENASTTTNTQVVRLLDKLQSGQQAEGKTEVVRLSSSQKMEKSPKIFFKTEKGKIVSCFKAILQSISRQENDNCVSVMSPSSNFMSFMEKPLRVTIIMTSGGHFAAAVFDGSICLNHKTFHSYTVRAKQGGSQGRADNKSGGSHPKSAGASLRRYNEQSYTQHVQDLLGSWQKLIHESQLIFIRAVGSNANILFGGKNPPLNKDSSKIRTVPFPTKRPTFNEVKRVHSFLTTIHVYESMDTFLAAHTHFNKNATKPKPASSPSKKKTHNRAKSRSPKRKDDLEICKEVNSLSDDDLIDDGPLEEVEQTVDFSELKEYDDSLTPEERKEGKRKKNKKPKPETFKPEGIILDLLLVLQKRDIETFKNMITQVSQENQVLDLNQPIDAQNSTLLHEATRNDMQDCVWCLMEAGCDPAARDKSGKCPYNYAESRECRDTFRRFMGQYPEKFDYQKAQVPPPLSEEMEKERAEKKKLLNKMKREKEKQKKTERKVKEKETEEQSRFLNLSDREKRALAAEQRILAQCKRNSEKPPVLVRCFECAVDISGKVPFEYNQNVFCTTKCLAVHRKKCPCPLSV